MSRVGERARAGAGQKTAPTTLLKIPVYGLVNCCRPCYSLKALPVLQCSKLKHFTIAKNGPNLNCGGGVSPHLPHPGHCCHSHTRTGVPET